MVEHSPPPFEVLLGPLYDFNEAGDGSGNEDIRTAGIWHTQAYPVGGQLHEMLIVPFNLIAFGKVFCFDVGHKSRCM